MLEAGIELRKLHFDARLSTFLVVLRVLELVPKSPVVRFGTFEVDLRLGEVRKNGTRIKLTGQPFQILVILLEHPGDLVTREQLQRQLWPSDTFVDFDRGLNAAINRVREALGDSAENPRFVETLPRRGYRFIAPIDVGADLVPEQQGVVPVRLQREGEETVRKPSLQRYWVLGSSSTAIILIAVLFYWFSRPLMPPKVLGYSRITNDGHAKKFRIDALPVIATDGLRLYFTEAANSGMRSTLNQVSASGGETSPVSAPFEQNIELGDVAPNHSDLLLQTFVAGDAEMPVWILPALGGAPRRLSEVRGRDAAWSRNGQMIAYAKGNELYVCKADGTETRKLVAASGQVRWPRWSPRGSFLRFTVGDPRGWTSIEEVSVAGGSSHSLLPGWKGVYCCGNWTPDGRYYVFQSTSDSGTNIWALRERTRLFRGRRSEPVRLTAGPMDFQSPVSSVDGKRLFVIGEQPRGELVRFETKSGQFVPYLEGISAKDVDVSKDGQWVVYVSYPEGVLWRSKVDGSQRLQLTSLPMQASLPRWSPDGKRIAFSGGVPGEPDSIYLVAAGGGRPAQLTDHYETDPNWSPDQNSLLFGDEPWFEAGAPGSAAIHILDLKTRQVSTLTGSEGLFSPHLSPNGRYVLAMSLDSARLMLFDFSTNKWAELVSGPAAYPNWSRDGSYIYFINPYIAEPAIYRIRISDRKRELITTLGRQLLGWSIAGKWTGLAGDDSPLVLRDTGSEEIYALDWEAP
jgi:Tol biopolymer transport system component/DNA-binding winged helix-turn-helix (wHTH) protein